MATFECNALTSAGRRTKGTFVCFIVLVLTGAAVEARRSTIRTVELTLHPAEASEIAEQYRLLPKTAEQTDADAVPLYNKALESLPGDSQLKKFTEWRNTPLDKLPVAQVESSLQKLRPTLDLAAQAAHCRQCNWPAIAPDKVSNELMQDLSKYRPLAFVLAVQARLQIAQGRYEQAIGTMQTNLAMARHLGEAPTLVQGLVGLAIAALTLNQVEELIEMGEAPNLYWALQDLPEPPVDLTKTMELEIANLKNYNFLVRKQFEKQLKPAHERVRMQMSAVDRRVTALQCIEALRLYAGSHDGKFPDQLSDVTEVTVPDDPVTKKPFSYYRTSSKAVLEAQGTEGSEGRDAIRYELNLKE